MQSEELYVLEWRDKTITRETYSLFGQITVTNARSLDTVSSQAYNPQTFQKKLLYTSNGGRDFAINHTYNLHEGMANGTTVHK